MSCPARCAETKTHSCSPHTTANPTATHLLGQILLLRHAQIQPEMQPVGPGAQRGPHVPVAQAPHQLRLLPRWEACDHVGQALPVGHPGPQGDKQLQPLGARGQRPQQALQLRTAGAVLRGELHLHALTDGS
jgi:hypothetical protein